jgi:hypothetical protein
MKERVARRKPKEWHERHGITSVSVTHATIESLLEQGEAADWTPEQYRAAMSEVAQKATGALIEEQDKPAS